MGAEDPSFAAKTGPNRPYSRPFSGASDDFYSRARGPIFAASILGNPFMIVVRIFTVLLVLWVAMAPASAQDRRVPASAAELRLSYAPIVQHLQPAVVTGYAAKVVQDRNPLLDDPIFRRFFGVPGGQQEQLQR